VSNIAEDTDALLEQALDGEITQVEVINSIRDKYKHFGLIRAKEFFQKRKQKMINDCVWEKMKEERNEDAG